MSKANPFRFSAKYQDDETDLLYYGYRYYDASQGNWTSRDPAEEKGGPNLYAFVARNPVSKRDLLGLLSDEHVIARCSCQCLSAVVTYQPGGDHLELEAYVDFGLRPLTVRFGNQVHVNWNVWGNPAKCTYFQDEENTWAKLDGISPSAPNMGFYRGTHGYQWGHDYTDPMGIDVYWLAPGEYRYTVHWDVIFRCVSSDGTTVTRHDVFPDLVRSFTVPQ